MTDSLKNKPTVVADLQEQLDELRDRIKILELRTIKLVKVGTYR